MSLLEDIYLVVSAIIVVYFVIYSIVNYVQLNRTWDELNKSIDSLLEDISDEHKDK